MSRVMLHALEPAEAVIALVDDGGDGELGACQGSPEVLRGVDWRGNRGYDQTLKAAPSAGRRLTALGWWLHVDSPDDLACLRRRLGLATEPALVRLRAQ